MVLPVVPVICVAGMAGAAYLLAWYHSQDRPTQRAADREAVNIARAMFGKAPEALSEDEAVELAAELRRRFPENQEA